MARIIRILLAGLIGAGIVHILVVLLVPIYSDRNAWSRISALGDAYIFHNLQQGNGRKLASDPLFIEAACRFDLDGGPIHITMIGQVPYWSGSIYSRNGDNLFSFNDSISSNGLLDLIIANPATAAGLKAKLSADIDRPIIVDQDIDEGIVVLRVFVPDSSWRQVADTLISSAQCSLMQEQDALHSLKLGSRSS